MELVLPNNYVELEQEEMMYLDGGWSGYTVARNLWNLAAMGWAGALLVGAGNVMWNAAKSGVSFWGAVAKVGYAAKEAFALLPLWAKIAVGVGTAATIWALGTWEF